MKYDYNICTNADEQIFENQCQALETHIPNLVKDKLLEDVDGSKTQRYYKDKKEILVKIAIISEQFLLNLRLSWNIFLNKST